MIYLPCMPTLSKMVFHYIKYVGHVELNCMEYREQSYFLIYPLSHNWFCVGLSYIYYMKQREIAAFPKTLRSLHPLADINTRAEKSRDKMTPDGLDKKCFSYVRS